MRKAPMSDRFDEMAERVQLDMEAYVLRQTIDGRRQVIANALRSEYERGLAEIRENALPPLIAEVYRLRDRIRAILGDVKP